MRIVPTQRNQKLKEGCEAFTIVSAPTPQTILSCRAMNDSTGKGKQIASSAGLSPSVSPKVSQEPALTTRLSLYLPFFSAYQSTDTTVAANVVNDDLERASSSSVLAQPDPFLFRDALKTSPQLADLRRRRKTGKRLEKYHRRQNNVCFRINQTRLVHRLIFFALVDCVSAKTNGGPYRRSKDRRGGRPFACDFVCPARSTILY